MTPYYKQVIMQSVPEFKWPEKKYAEIRPIHRNDTGSYPDPYAKVGAAPTISLTVGRAQLPQPAVFAIGIVAGVALLLLAYKFYPQVFKYFKPKAQ